MKNSIETSQIMLLTIALAIALPLGTIGGCGSGADSPPPQPAAKALSSEEIETSLTAAERYFDGGGLAEAAAILRTLVDRAPEEVRARDMLARVLFHRAAAAQEEHKFDLAARLYYEAYAMYREVVRLEPDQAGWQQNAGDFALSAERIEDAIEHYRAAARLDPTSSRHPLYEAQLHLRLGDIDEAETAVRRALDLDPDSANAIATLASIHIERNEFDEGFGLIREAREIARPEEALYLRVMEARFARRAGDPQRALSLLVTLDEIERADPIAAEELAAAYLATGEPRLAVSAWGHSYEITRQWRAACGAARAALDAGLLARAQSWIAIARSTVGEHPDVLELEARLADAMSNGSGRERP